MKKQELQKENSRAVYSPFLGYRQHPTPGTIVLCSIIALAIWRIMAAPAWKDSSPQTDWQSGERLRVLRVIDGDTFLLEDKTRVRLLGVDTPETKHPDKAPQPWGKEASDFTQKHIEGDIVTLYFDKGRHDQYGRLLAYVYKDDWFLNEELIREGYSKAETNFPFSRRKKNLFQKAESEARQKKKGIWSLKNNLN